MYNNNPLSVSGVSVQQWEEGSLLVLSGESWLCQSVDEGAPMFIQLGIEKVTGESHNI